MLLNEQGAAGEVVNVGNYELLTVSAVSGSVVTFASAKTRFYGSAAGSDAGIGVAAGQQKVVLQRVPVWGALTVPAGATLTVSAWNGLTGGVLALRAVDLTIAGSLSVEAKGYRNGAASIDDSSCTNNLSTESGESIGGPPAVTTAANYGGSGGLSGGNGISFWGNTPLMASAGHSAAGQVGQNPNGRTLGPPGASYGIGDGSQVTMGSGRGGHLACRVGTYSPYLAPRSNTAGGIIAVYADSISVSSGGTIDASAISSTITSGGYVFMRANTLSLGAGQVKAAGGTDCTNRIVSGPATFTSQGSDGYVSIQYSTSLSGTTTPAASVVQQANLVLP